MLSLCFLLKISSAIEEKKVLNCTRREVILKKYSLGLFIGESFAELSLVDSQSKEKLDFQRWYLPRANLKSYLTKYINEKSITALDQVFVAHRFLEKLFSYRLGGSVAQVITNGFEKALQLEDGSTSDSLIWPQKPPAISSQELVFTVHEKVNADGKIEKAIDPETLEAISAKLKLMEVKRVCLHFRHSSLNTENLFKAKSFFEQAGFDVFIPPQVEASDEFKAWRKNLIEAAITGTFLEIQEDLRNALGAVVPAEKIYFLGAKLNWFQNEKDERLGSLLALENLWLKLFPEILKSQEKMDIFHFGLENFSLIQNENKNWQLPWGPLPMNSPKRKDFEIQPTQSLKVSDTNELIFDKKELSFEPGPISMGRGIIPCVYDILFFSESLATELQEKLKRSLQALLKSTHKTVTTPQAFKTLKKDILDRLAINAEFSNSNNTKQTVIYGYWADLLAQDIKDHSYFSKLPKISEKDWPKSFMIAHWGLKEKR